MRLSILGHSVGIVGAISSHFVSLRGDVGKSLSELFAFIFDHGQFFLKLLDHCILLLHLELQHGNFDMVLLLFNLHNADMIVQSVDLFSGRRAHALWNHYVLDDGFNLALFFFAEYKYNRLFALGGRFVFTGC